MAAPMRAAMQQMAIPCSFWMVFASLSNMSVSAQTSVRRSAAFALSRLLQVSAFRQAWCARFDPEAAKPLRSAHIQAGVPRCIKTRVYTKSMCAENFPEASTRWERMMQNEGTWHGVLRRYDARRQPHATRRMLELPKLYENDTVVQVERSRAEGLREREEVVVTVQRKGDEGETRVTVARDDLERRAGRWPAGIALCGEGAGLEGSFCVGTLDAEEETFQEPVHPLCSKRCKRLQWLSRVWVQVEQSLIVRQASSDGRVDVVEGRERVVLAGSLSGTGPCSIEFQWETESLAYFSERRATPAPAHLESTAAESVSTTKCKEATPGELLHAELRGRWRVSWAEWLGAGGGRQVRVDGREAGAPEHRLVCWWQHGEEDVGEGDRLIAGAEMAAQGLVARTSGEMRTSFGRVFQVGTERLLQRQSAAAKVNCVPAVPYLTLGHAACGPWLSF